MQPDYPPPEHPPQKPWQSANRKQNDAQNDVGGPVILGQPDLNFVLGQVGDITRQSRSVMMHGLAHQDPSHVRPPLAIVRRMRIALVVRKLMMNPMRGYPENRPPLERKSGAPGQEIFHPLRSLISAMRQQPVICHPNPEAARYPP